MLKKVITLLMVTILILGLAGCGGEQQGAEEPSGDDWKIGVITGTSSQNEEEFVAGRELVEKYGEDRVIHKPIPITWQETGNNHYPCYGYGFDPSVKAIVLSGSAWNSGSL